MRKGKVITGLLAAFAGLALLAAPLRTAAEPKQPDFKQMEKRLERQLTDKTAMGGVARKALAPQAKARYLVSKETRFLMGSKDWEQFSQIINKYDKKGRQTYNKFTYLQWDEEKEKNVEHTSEWKSVYDSKGRIIKHTSYEDGKEQFRYEDKYNSKNQLTEEKYYREGKYTGRYVYSYNKKGKTSRLEYYNAKKQKEWTRTYSFDKHGNVYKVVQKTPKGKVLNQWTIKNTYRGSRLIKSVETDKAKSYTETITYYTNGNWKTYIFKNKQIEQREEFYENGGAKKFEWKEEGSYRLETFYKDGSRKKEITEFDDYREEIDYKNDYPEKRVVDSYGEKHTYTYSYKKKSGRVVRQLEKEGKNPVEKIEFEYVKIG